MAVASATSLQPVANAIARLQALLAKARSIKPESTVEPPLPVAPLLADVNSFKEDFGGSYDQAYQFSAIETAAREIFSALITSATIQDPAFVEVWNMLDILIICSDQDQCTPELACYLIEELLDSQTTSGCRTVFDYLESRRERLVQKDFHKKNLVFLRTCNELLRRLSRAEDAIFCGRVFFFLFQTFPLGDKSSVNLRGEFHVENTTKFEVLESESAQDAEKMEVDAEPAKAESEATKTGTPQPPSKPGSKAVPIKPPPKKEEEVLLSNSDLYPIFWRLQQDFCEPTRLFAPEHFQRFKKGVAYTITKFKKTPTVVQTLAGEDTKRGIKRKLNDQGDTNGHTESDEGHFQDQYNPKYLTSRDLFDLELSDQAFQRHVLLQCTILIDFLLSLTEKAKKRLATVETPNKSLLYNFTLSDEETKWSLATRKAISDYLSTTQDGKLFNRMVDTVLARDKNWIRWKIESCPSIVRGPFSTESESEARKGSKNETRIRRPSERAGAAVDLSFLVEDSESCLNALEDPERYTVMPIDTILDGIERDKLDLDFAVGEVEEAQWNSLIATKRWRVLRQTAMDRLGLLDKVKQDNNLATVFRPPPESTPEHAPGAESELQVEREAANVLEEDGAPEAAPTVEENGVTEAAEASEGDEVAQGAAEAVESEMNEQAINVVEEATVVEENVVEGDAVENDGTEVEDS